MILSLRIFLNYQHHEQLHHNPGGYDEVTIKYGSYLKFSRITLGGRENTYIRSVNGDDPIKMKEG